MSTAEQNEQEHQQKTQKIPPQQQQQQQQQQQTQSVQQIEHTTTATTTTTATQMNNTSPSESDAYDDTINIQNQNSINVARNFNANEVISNNQNHAAAAASSSSSSSSPPPPQYSDIQMQQEEQLQQDTAMAALGLTLMQSSPPPHSYRHSRAYRHFKNPPQPHMCIRTTTEAGEELFINVLSWTRIVIPQEPSDPIPLYGGMRVPPGSPRSPPIVFAVMANPEVLKDSGRHSKDAEERRAMVELMCDFVEAMNPGVKLVRNAIILRDRDISGELKDVWNAVQAQRDREREEQMLAQRQQQHYQNITTQQMFPKSPDASAARASANAASAANQLLNGMENELLNGTTISLEVFAQQLDNKVASEQLEQQLKQQRQQQQQLNVVGSQKLQCSETNDINDCVDQTDAGAITNHGHHYPHVLANDNQTINAISSSSSSTSSSLTNNAQNDATKVAATENKIININMNSTTNSTTTSSTNTTSNVTNTANVVSPVTTTATTTTTAATPAPTNAPPPKKEKLGGFLPNGCIFPRFKNNKNKDKDNQKESKGKEKTLLNALKSKSKDKKVAPIDTQHATTTTTTTTNNDKTTGTTTSQNISAPPPTMTRIVGAMTTMTQQSHVQDATQYEKNCINNLESEVQKLDLNKIETAANNDSMFIKLKVASNTATAAAAK